MKSQVSDNFIQEKQKKLYDNLHKYETSNTLLDNKHRKKYDMKALKKACKDLSIDFDDFLIYCRKQILNQNKQEKI